MACLSSTVDGGISHLALRDYVVNPNYGQRWSGSFNLVHAMAQVVPSGWVKRKSITFEDTAKHSLFKRVGRKDEDTRNWDFGRMEHNRGNYYPLPQESRSPLRSRCASRRSVGSLHGCPQSCPDFRGFQKWAVRSAPP